MSGRFEHFDARRGGSYRLVLTYAAGSTGTGKATADTDIVEARFLDLVPGVRVAQAVDFVSDDPAYSGTMVMTWELSPSTAERASRSARKTFLRASLQTTMLPGSRHP